MAIAKKPVSNQNDIAAERFISAKPDAKEKRKGAIIRFDPDLLRRIDTAAKSRGVSRAAWVQMVLSRALDAGEG
jgi:predicted HicB family RNase H-like nuclease